MPLVAANEKREAATGLLAGRYGAFEAGDAGNVAGAGRVRAGGARQHMVLLRAR